MLRCPYNDYSSLNRWQAHRDYFLYLLSVMTHRRQGKKVSILPPVPSRRGLLEDSPYRAVGGCVSVVRRVIFVHLGCVETQECLVVTYARHEYILVTYALLSTQL
jgi:hypothetical protein